LKLFKELMKAWRGFTLTRDEADKESDELRRAPEPMNSKSLFFVVSLALESYRLIVRVPVSVYWVYTKPLNNLIKKISNYMVFLLPPPPNSLNYLIQRCLRKKA